MAYVPSKRWTVLDVLSMVRELTKTVDQSKVLVDQGRYFYNTALSEIVAVLNGALDPAYFVSEVIATSSEIVNLNISATAGDISNINITSNTITRVPGAWKVGDIFTVQIYDINVADVFSFVGRVISVDGTAKIATYTPIEGTEYTLNTFTNGSVWVISTLSTLTINTNSLSYSADKIVEIWDSTYGQCVKVDIGEFYSIGRSGFEHKSYDSDIVWTQIGNSIYLKNGSKCISPGTKTVIYQRQPSYPTLYDATEYVDIADKYVPLLVKRIYTYLILQTEVDVPKNLAQEMQTDYAQIAAFAGSELANRRGGEQQKR